MDNARIANQSVLFKSAALGSIILAVLLTGANVAINRLFQTESSLIGGVQIAVNLLIFWLVVTSILRSMHKLRSSIPGQYLIFGGVMVAFAGILLHVLLIQLLHWISPGWGLEPGYQTILFYGVLGIIVSIISLINLKVKNKMMGNVLEVLFIALVVFLFYTFMK